MASTKYYDNLPTSGNEHGRAFRDVELEKEVLEMTRQMGIGAQFGGKYFCHDVRIVRLPRHGASCPVAIGVSCSADRQVRAALSETLGAFASVVLNLFAASTVYTHGHASCSELWIHTPYTLFPLYDRRSRARSPPRVCSSKSWSATWASTCPR
jgi:hypothetical protein